MCNVILCVCSFMCHVILYVCSCMCYVILLFVVFIWHVILLFVVFMCHVIDTIVCSIYVSFDTIVCSFYVSCDTIICNIIWGAGSFDPICTAVCDRCDSSITCRLCRLETHSYGRLLHPRPALANAALRTAAGCT